MRQYATPTEFLNHPTGLNTDNLVYNGTDAQNTAELALVLQAASSAVDQWVFHPLYAHSRSETKRVRPQQWGTLDVKCDHFPIASITSAQWRQTAWDAWHTIDTTKVDIFPTLEGGPKYSAADAYYSGTYGWGQPPLTVQTTYVAGYPNMQLTASASANATSIVVDEFLGVNAGDTLKIYDGQNYEEVTVETTPTTTTIALSTPLQYAHSVGVRVSELPDVVWTSCILIAAYLIKERRAGASVMMSGTVQSMNVINAEDMQLVRQFLQPFRRVI